MALQRSRAVQWSWVAFLLHVSSMCAVCSDGASSCSDYCKPTACLQNSVEPTNPYTIVLTNRIDRPTPTADLANASCVSGVRASEYFSGTREVTMEVPLPNGETSINLTAEEYVFVKGPRFDFFRCQTNTSLEQGVRCRCSLHLFSCLVLPEGGNCSFYNQAANDLNYPFCGSPTQTASNYSGRTLDASVCPDSLLFPIRNRVVPSWEWFQSGEPNYRLALGGAGLDTTSQLAPTSPAREYCRRYVLKDRQPTCSIEMCSARSSAWLYFSNSEDSTSGAGTVISLVMMYIIAIAASLFLL